MTSLSASSQFGSSYTPSLGGYLQITRALHRPRKRYFQILPELSLLTMSSSSSSGSPVHLYLDLLGAKVTRTEDDKSGRKFTLSSSYFSFTLRAPTAIDASSWLIGCSTHSAPTTAIPSFVPLLDHPQLNVLTQAWYRCENRQLKARWILLSGFSISLFTCSRLGENFALVKDPSKRLRGSYPLLPGFVFQRRTAGLSSTQQAADPRDLRGGYDSSDDSGPEESVETELPAPASFVEVVLASAQYEVVLAFASEADLEALSSAVQLRTDIHAAAGRGVHNGANFNG